MPVFNQIELFLDETYPREEQKSFIFKSRCICNYLERALVEKEFETTLSRVNIHCSKDTDKVRVLPLKGAPFLEICIIYDLPPLAGLGEASLQGHYMHLIDLGLRAAESFMPVPHSYSMDILRRFKDGGFRNDWVQAEKSWEKELLRSDVLAQLTPEKFTLLHRIYREGHLVAKKNIVETKPREMLFIDYLGNLSRDDFGSVVYKRKGKVISKFNIDSGKFSDAGTLGR